MAACQATTTTDGPKLNETVSVESDWENSELGREFRIRSGISCKAWNYAQPTFSDEISKHFSSQYWTKIEQLRRNETSWVELCDSLPLVETKRQARSWLKTREGIAREVVKNDEYWIESPWRWSDTEEARIWHAFLCRKEDRSMGKAAQVTGEVIAENKPWNATRAKRIASSIAAKVSNTCSRGYDGIEKKFVSESKGVWKSYISLWRLGS